MSARELPVGHEEVTADTTSEELNEYAQRMWESKKDTPLLASKATFKEGNRFRVVREGARLEGLVYFGETTWSGWSRNLEVGEIVTCTGWQPAWNAEHVSVANFTAENVPPNARWCSVWPIAGLFLPWPMPGFLEPLDTNDEEGV